jgi:hypothetical protein
MFLASELGVGHCGGGGTTAAAMVYFEFIPHAILYVCIVPKITSTWQNYLHTVFAVVAY